MTLDQDLEEILSEEYEVTFKGKKLSKSELEIIKLILEDQLNKE